MAFEKVTTDERYAFNFCFEWPKKTGFIMIEQTSKRDIIDEYIQETNQNDLLNDNKWLFLINETDQPFYAR